jgi:Iron-binding zinc finger CDGSH type.
VCIKSTHIGTYLKWKLFLWFSKINHPLIFQLINKYYSKHHDVVTDRFTIDTGIHTEAICRCWKSKKFPFCDNSHKYHNKFHKDNVGPLIIDGNTFPDYVLDKYTLPTPNRSITYPTPSTMSDSQVDKAIDKYVKENEYSQDSDENSTCTIDKNDFFERLRKWPPGLGPQTAKFGWSWGVGLLQSFQPYQNLEPSEVSTK